MEVGRSINGRFAVGHIPWSSGKKMSGDFIAKMRVSLKGRVAWNKGNCSLPFCTVCNKKLGDRRNISGKCRQCLNRLCPPAKGFKLSDEGKEKISKRMKGILPKNWAYAVSKSVEKRTGVPLTQEHIKKCLQRRPMSSLEVKVMGIIREFDLPFKFVGNGDFFIEKKNPDFVSTGERKVVVEVFARKHKELFRGGVIRWIKERRKLFLRKGWVTVFLDEVMCNNKADVVNMLGGHKV